MSKIEVKWLPEDGVYEVRRYNDKGEVSKTKEQYKALKPMDELKAARHFEQLASSLHNKREAACTLIGYILKANEDAVIEWKANCAATESLPKGFKEAFRDAEKAYFQQWMATDTVQDGEGPAVKVYRFPEFVKSLPRVDKAGRALHGKDGKLNVSEQFEAFLSATRADPSYSNAKNMCLSFWAYLGRTPFNDEGNLIPPEAIRVYVDNFKVITPPDDSIKTKLIAIQNEMIGEKKNPPLEHLPYIEASLQTMLDHIKELRNILKASEGSKDVKTSSDEAILKMQASANAAREKLNTGAARKVKDEEPMF